MSGLFANRNAVVTGGASGIGLAVAEALVAGGARVMVIDRAAALASQPGPDLSMAVDLADPDAITALPEVIEQTLGKLDILVNSAAIFHNASIAASGADVFDRLYAVNLRAPYLTTRALAPLLSRACGAVVNISSTGAIRSSRHNIIYDSLKAALDHMTRGLAAELGPQNIRVNTVQPGGTHTGGLKDWLALLPRVDPPETEMARLLEQRVIARSEDIAAAVLLLLSPGAAWVNGATLTADNGRHLQQGD